MSAVDVELYIIIAVSVGGLVIWLLFYAFSGQTKPAANLTEETLKRLVGSIGRATSDITESTGTVFVNNAEFRQRRQKGLSEEELM
jgi:membrane protein implicated in regulation of membrane protease activity